MLAKSLPPITESDLARLTNRLEIDPETNCHNWTGSVNEFGYGLMRIAGRTVRTHRVAYSVAKGEPPLTLQLDHLCRNRKCANPDHLEAVTSRENTLRGVGPGAINALKEQCPRGHALAGDNLHRALEARGGRACRACDTAARGARHRGLTGVDRETFIQIRADENYAKYMAGSRA